MARSVRPATFSIAAADMQAREWGVAVQSKFLAAGSLVPWVKAEVGAIATQAWANVGFGPAGLEKLARGLPAAEVVRELISADEGGEDRQIGVVDREGRAAAFTGERCFAWAGHVVGEGFCCQGNILTGPETVEAMARAFHEAGGPLAERLVAALAAGDGAGGDRRGKQSAGILVAKEKGGYGGYTDRYVDLRVDDHPEPVAELRRLLDLFRLYFSRTDPRNLVRIEGDVLGQVTTCLRLLGYYTGGWTGSFGGELAEGMRRFYLMENFEERMREDDLIDAQILEFMKQAASRR